MLLTLAKFKNSVGVNLYAFLMLMKHASESILTLARYVSESVNAGKTCQ
jgi:hypothetical protein